MRRRIVVLVSLALACIASVAPAGAAPIHVSDGTGPLDTAADLDAALRFEELIDEHTFYGMVTPLLFDAWPHLDPEAQPLRFDGEADSGNYTGVYLAAQSWRYAQAKAELATLGADPDQERPAGPADVRFWQKQRDEAATRAEEMVRYYHILVNIAREWQTSFDPQVDTSKAPTESGFLDYGGGVIPGEAGLLMRACTPENPDPAFADVRVNYAGHHRLRGPWPWEDGQDWYCIGGTSRDSYAGTIFGLSVALDFLDDPELQELLADDLMAMTDYAVKYLWWQPRPHGRVVNPIEDNDLDGPVSPLFTHVSLHRLHLLQTARHAAEVIGDTEAALRYDALWAKEVAVSVASGDLLASMLFDASFPHDSYYKYQLHLMSFFNVIRLEPDPVIREELARAMGALDATLTDDGNAFFEAVTFGLTGETERLHEAVGYHREWLDYYAFHEEAARQGTTPFVHTGRCDIEEDPGPEAPVEKRPLECVPEDRVDMVLDVPLAGEVIVPHHPGTSEDLRAKDPLPVGVRRYADFLWQKDPTIIDGDHDVPWRGPSIDFLGTYWMLRYYSEVEVPEPDPLPAWPGPRFE